MAPKNRLYRGCTFVDFNSSAHSALKQELEGRLSWLHVGSKIENTREPDLRGRRVGQRKLSDLFGE